MCENWFKLDLPVKHKVKLSKRSGESKRIEKKE